jgi:MoaA/NifB/PqqE/SkfB family radical SAM enzyme
MLSPWRKKLRLLKAYMAGYPVWGTWQITYRCNFGCNFCNYWQTPHTEEVIRSEATPDDFRRGAARLAELGSLMISIAGGEPSLRKDLPEMVAALAEWHFPFVTTNGFLMDDAKVKALWKAGLWGVSVSIDYAEQDKHNARRNHAAAFQRAERALMLFDRHRLHRWQRVNLMCVLFDDNLDQIEPLLALAAKHHAYFMVQPYSTRKVGVAKHLPKPGVSGYLKRLRERWPNFLSNPYFLGNFDRFLTGGVPGCRAGDAFFNIDQYGGVSICVEERHGPVGNLYRDPVKTLVKRLHAVAKGNTCTDCWYNCRGEVEMLYKPGGLLKSLPTWLFDRGRAEVGPTAEALSAARAEAAAG